MGPYTIFVPHPSNLVTDHWSSGDGLVAWGFLHRLAQRGHRLHVACQRISLAEPPPPNLHLYQLSTAPKLRGAERLRYMVRMRRLFAALARRERIDVAHQLNPVDLGLSLALPPTAPPLVLGPYVPDWPAAGPRTGSAVLRRLDARGRDWIRRRQQSRAALVLVSTAAAEQKVPTPGVRIETLSGGVEVEEFFAVERAPRDRPPTVLFLANVQVRKGILVLVDAFERVLQARPDARLVVAGGGPDEGRLRERLAASPAAGSVELIGRVARERVPEVMAAADVYCLPSDGEPFGISALEAMAAGLPLVVTDAGGLRHLLPDDGGAKVPPGDADALAAAILDLLGDPDRRAAMGAINRAAVHDRYAWPAVVDRLEHLYAELATTRR